MNIKFSRHSKRRLKLYKIDPNDFKYELSRKKSIPSDKSLIKVLSSKHIIDKYKYPLKIVFKIEGSDIIVITAYPLKKGKVK